MSHRHWYDERALEIARQFTPDNDPQQRAALQVAIIEAMKAVAPSAPVGVEGRAREAVALALDEAGHPTEANNVRSGIDLDEYRVELCAARIALAQQPAAVDEAWQEGQRVEWQDNFGDWHPAVIVGVNPATYDARLDDGCDALQYPLARFRRAGQQHGGPQE